MASVRAFVTVNEPSALALILIQWAVVSSRLAIRSSAEFSAPAGRRPVQLPRVGAGRGAQRPQRGRRTALGRRVVDDGHAGREGREHRRIGGVAGAIMRVAGSTSTGPMQSAGQVSANSGSPERSPTFRKRNLPHCRRNPVERGFSVVCRPESPAPHTPRSDPAAPGNDVARLTPRVLTTVASTPARGSRSPTTGVMWRPLARTAAYTAYTSLVPATRSASAVRPP